MIKNGGYTMLDLATATYKDAQTAFNANKPILVYDNSQVYYADTCVYDSDNDAYVITKGGKTITIDSSNNVVSSGDIYLIMENIEDSKGNKRFIEGTPVWADTTGVEIKYCKWSLSGTHLMVVIAGSIADSASIVAGAMYYALNNMPSYIKDKIYATWSSNVSYDLVSTHDDGWSTSLNIGFSFKKTNEGAVYIQNQNNISNTTGAEQNFRVQFDLLIDADYSE